MKKPCSATDPLWYKDAIIYELHVRAFADSNADGIGDFQGLISKLDYLQELGVTCLWLLPFFPSPLRDDGYDIANYVDVNPSYGSIDDFKQFLAEAHARNMQVMIELVINHTSDQHPWFQRARLAPKDSPERNMYVWSDTDKKFEGVRIIFTDTEKSNWTWDEVAQQYYWHRFFAHQPDLNFDNPRVMEEVLNAMRFWMDMGVDGLRLDAIPYLIERDGTSCENVPETHHLIQHIRAVLDTEYENRLILAEANMWPADVRPYFGEGDECHMAFHFPLMPRIYMALRQEDRLPITDIMAQTPAIPDNCQWGLFLRNHDELTLEMVTDDERDYMNLAYAADTRMRINVGIRRRLAPLVDNNRRRIELLNSLLLSFPGTPIMYYGDEIGMGDNIYLGDRNGVRTPMQWNSDRNAGFSKAVPAKLYFPVIMDPIWGYQAINVEAQQSDASSLLHWTRNMIALRKIFQVFGRGTLEFLHPENRKVLAYIREFTGEDGHSETVLCVANLSRFAQPVGLDLSKYVGRQPVEMLGYVPFPIINEAPYAITLAPYSFFWLELQPGPARPPNPIVDLLQEATPTPDAAPANLSSQSQPASSTKDLSSRPGPERAKRTEGVVERPAVPTHAPSLLAVLKDLAPNLDSILPAYIAKQRWFGGKSRTIRSTRIASTNSIDAASLIALVEITYTDNSTDLYQLPLALAAATDAASLQTSSPNAIITTLDNAALIDASASPTFRAALLKLIIAVPTTDSKVPSTNPGAPSSSIVSSSTKVGDSPQPLANTIPNITATRSTALDPARLADVPSRLGSAEQSNTSILYDDLAILKLFRRVRSGSSAENSGENPDVEIARFLTEVAHFDHVPAYLGDLHLTADSTTLAFLQAFAPNLGDGWAWTLAGLDRFFSEIATLPPPTNPSSRPDALPANLSSRPEASRSETAAERPAASSPDSIRAHASAYLDAAALLGQRTAELHLALATPTDNPAFAAAPTTPEDLANDRQRIHQQLTAALDALQSSLKAPTNPGAPGLASETWVLATELLSHRDDLLARVASLNGDPARFGQRIRIHGDYHLGQLLRTQSKTSADFLLIDFEGEPARSLADRRKKQSPLRDVAGMLRSFSYAARTALQSALTANANNATNLTAWANAWETAVTASFLDAYTSTIAANPALLPHDTSTLIDALLLEKASYELLYELNNRPTWLVIPLEGLLAIARNGA
ncbi:MAG TPA: maltose alpha-D-glucosyltransferase [Acidobacteriaceae bacterium]|nr:maltose alpha-D-glucosyltransferase [Acidobacteriaceae bacterium]